LVCQVTAADINDRTALESMLSKLNDKFPFIKKLWADMGCQGKNLRSRMSNQAVDLEIIKRPRKYAYVPEGVKDVTAYLRSIGHEVVEGFKVLPRRWVIERTFAWIGRHRRMSKDYEFLTQTQEGMMFLAMTRIMLRRTVSGLN
jgi:transposase